MIFHNVTSEGNRLDVMLVRHIFFLPIYLIILSLFPDSITNLSHNVKYHYMKESASDDRYRSRGSWELEKLLAA